MSRPNRAAPAPRANEPVSAGAEAISREIPYGFVKELRGVSFDDAVRRITEALGAQGFGVLTEIDVQKTLAKKLGIDFRQYAILGACNPTLARKALEAEPQIGLLLPCNVVVQEHPEGRVVVSIADPRAMFTLVENPGLESVADEADRRLRAALETLSSASGPD
jgi:uncharacterized protein (DUF302 family)